MTLRIMTRIMLVNIVALSIRHSAKCQLNIPISLMALSTVSLGIMPLGKFLLSILILIKLHET
jgi:hypothetical protein